MHPAFEQSPQKSVCLRFRLKRSLQILQKTDDNRLPRHEVNVINKSVIGNPSKSTWHAS